MKIIILVGLPGAGKSTFCKLLPEFTRVNQDELGNRQDCINATKRAFQQEKSVIIDRCGFSKAQRRYFIDVAKDYNAEIYCVYIATPAETCIERIKTRTVHPNLNKDMAIEKITEIVYNFNRDLELPDYSEGYEEVYNVTDDKTASSVAGFFRNGATDK